MSDVSPSAVSEALTKAGIEVYRVVGAEIQIAERVRLHIMDSGIRVDLSDGIRIIFRARSQRSDYPHIAPDALLGRVREAIGAPAAAHGFIEDETVSREILDPAEATQVLDVWHEVTYVKRPENVAALVEDLRWALTLDKYVSE